MRRQNIFQLPKNHWKHYRVFLVNPTTKEDATVEVWAFNEGQASFLGLRKTHILPCLVDKVEEIEEIAS